MVKVYQQQAQESIDLDSTRIVGSARAYLDGAGAAKRTLKSGVQDLLPTSLAGLLQRGQQQLRAHALSPTEQQHGLPVKAFAPGDAPAAQRKMRDLTKGAVAPAEFDKRVQAMPASTARSLVASAQTQRAVRAKVASVQRAATSAVGAVVGRAAAASLRATKKGGKALRRTVGYVQSTADGARYYAAQVAGLLSVLSGALSARRQAGTAQGHDDDAVKGKQQAVAAPKQQQQQQQQQQHGSDALKSALAAAAERVHAAAPGVCAGFRQVQALLSTGNGLKSVALAAAPLVLASAVGGYAVSASALSWYSRLRMPFFAPPQSTFAVVWHGLYCLMGAAFHRIVTLRLGSNAAARRTRKWAVAAYCVQLALNATWSFSFFVLRHMGLSLVHTLVYLASTVVNAVLFRKLDRAAFLLLVPLVLWSGFASVLHGAIALLN